jgi:phage-related protein
MQLQCLIEGAAFTLWAILQGENVVDYLEQLEHENKQAYAQIAKRLEQLSERGSSRKKDEFNVLGNGLFEVKARSGPRVIFFYDAESIVICSHAFDKRSQKTPKKEIDKALARKNSYFAEKQARHRFDFIWDKGHEPKRKP